MLKAFIGSNYLSVSFAFLQSGLGLGIGGLIFIASLTDHCCHLIVKTKYHAIRKVMNLHNSNQNDRPNDKQDKYVASFHSRNDKQDKYVASFHSRKYSLLSSDEENDKCTLVDKDSHCSDDEEEYVIYDVDSQSIMEQHMMKHMSYGDIGRLSFGKAGIFIVNFCIVITQFGFCVAYFIFIGNTVYSMFPYRMCLNTVLNTTNSNMSREVSNVPLVPLCETYYINLEPSKYVMKNKTFLHNKRNVNGTENGIISSSTLSPIITDYMSETSHVNLSTVMPEKTNSLSLSNTSETTEKYSVSTNELKTGSSLSQVLYNTGSTISQTDNTGSTLSNTSATSTSTSLHTTEETTAASKTDTDSSDVSTKVWESTAPSLKLLVACPLPIFIMFAFIRTVRKLGFISVIANTAIFIGCLSVMFYVIIDFEVSEDVVWMKWSGLPVFFGMVTAAFEGIGLVIPVESSMEGNRHNFNKFLHGAVFVLSSVLAAFGILGYLRFGNDLHQMLNTNIPSTSWMSFSVNICVAIGVLFTFPLQIYPVIELTEIALFSEGSLCGPKKDNKLVLDDEIDNPLQSSNDKEALLPKESPPPAEMPISVAVHIPESVPSWKRNVLRIVIVLFAAGLAVIFRNSFAYVGAFTGAVGSSLLAYILPCLFHLKLCRQELPYFIIIKDVAIVIVGVCCSIISLYTVILNLIQNTGL